VKNGVLEHPIHRGIDMTLMPAPPSQLAIVVPCYNEQEVLSETCTRLAALLARLHGAGKIVTESRIYFVDDGSRDRTWQLVTEFVRGGLPVVGVKLSHNRGHQNALMAGLFSAAGDAVVTIDADLQDDLEAIEAMLDEYHGGCDVVYGVRRRRDTDSLFKKLTAETFYRLMAGLGAQTIHNHADYRLLSRRALESLKGYQEANLYLRGIIPLIGYRSAIVEYERVARFAGQSKYPLGKMAALALDAITSFSIFPLRLISFIGLVVFGGAMSVTGWALWAALFSDKTIPGWASVVLPMYFLGGVELLALGIIGEYLGKLYMEAKRRPRFFIEQTIGDSASRPHSEFSSIDLATDAPLDELR
jgi:polyisoprenyl-phosphate glycosyltransferase